MANLPSPNDLRPPIVTNNQILNQWAGITNFSGTAPQEELTEWDKWRKLFEPLPRTETPPWPGRIDPRLRAEIRHDPSVTLREVKAKRAQTIREIELAQRGDQHVRGEQQEGRSRLKDLATKYLGRDPTPAEMQTLWFRAVDEAEAASLIGIEADPWDALEGMANSEDAPGVGRKPTTSTSTHTTINLTDPETAKGIILTALRDALGRRANDDEIAQFSAALRAEEEANPTVSTTTSTTDPEGNTTSSSQTTGGAPSPSAVATTFLDDELNAEIDIFRAGTEYFQVAQALAGGIA